MTKAIRVTFDSGDTLETEINGTHESIEKYYIGNYFNVGSVNDKIAKAVKVQFLDEEGV